MCDGVRSNADPLYSLTLRQLGLTGCTTSGAFPAGVGRGHVSDLAQHPENGIAPALAARAFLVQFANGK